MRHASYMNFHMVIYLYVLSHGVLYFNNYSFDRSSYPESSIMIGGGNLTIIVS